MTTPKFSLDEIVFAKLKGWPPWPAKVEFFENVPSGNKVKYNVYFYGTNQIAQCREEDLFSYVEHRKTLGKPKKAGGFMKAIYEADSELRKRSESASSRQDLMLTNLDYLKAELAVLKIDQGIKKSLSLSKPNLASCLRLLDEYFEIELTPLMFKKNPQLIGTLVKLQVYSNEEHFDNQIISEKSEDSCERKMCLIRQKAKDIYLKVKSLFNPPQERPFLEYFADLLIRFKESVAWLSETDLLQLTSDPTLTTTCH